jgi:hypothetical protein
VAQDPTAAHYTYGAEVWDPSSESWSKAFQVADIEKNAKEITEEKALLFMKKGFYR